MLQSLQIDNQALIAQAQKDTESLESQQVEIEKLKLQNQRQKAESDKLAKELKQRNEMQRQAPFPQNTKNDRASLIKQDASLLENEWLSSTLNQKIKDFQEIGNIVIKNFGNQMTSNILTGETAPDQEIINNIDEDMASEAEEDLPIE